MAANSKMINQLWKELRLSCTAAAGNIRFHQSCTAPGVLNAVNHGDCGKDGDDPKDGSHNIKQGSNDYQHQTFRALHKPYSASANQRLRASATVTNHDRTDHHVCGQGDIVKATAAGKEN